jgi:hypothetical protein
MKMLWYLLRPSRLGITFFITLTLLTSTVTTGFEATSKVTWHANRGLPFPYITIFEYVQGGRCLINTVCVATNIKYFNPYALLLDMLVWYLVACALVFGYEFLKKQRRE